MSTQYESVHTALLYPDAFHVCAPDPAVGREVWPRQPGVFIRAGLIQTIEAPEAVESAEEVEDADKPPRAPPPRELVAGQFGLVPPWVKSASDAKLRSTKLVNARSETVTTSTNFRGAWLAGQRCIVPMRAFIEEDWRSGKPVPTRISRVDGKPMGVAGLWESWTGADGAVIVSFTLLTVNANSHALMGRYQPPGNEKRMLAILNEGAYDAWLSARPDKAKEFMRAYPANWLTANPVEKGR
jgi:putative SOS response-associated peptidase YedK